MGKIRDYSLNFLNATIGSVVGFNLAGLICSIDMKNPIAEIGVISGLTAAGTILGYKARKIKAGINRRIGRAKARNEFLEEVVKEGGAEFLERQGIKKGTSGNIRSGLRYLLTVPLGGALGYFPGTMGIVPLCVHFGEFYNWDRITILSSGAFAGSVVGAYAFAEMTYKRQYEKFTTAACALAGASGASFIPAQLRLNMLDDIPDMYAGLGVVAGGAIVGAVAGNLIYKGVKKLVRKKKQG